MIKYWIFPWAMETQGYTCIRREKVAERASEYKKSVLCILLINIAGIYVLRTDILHIQKLQNKLPADGSAPTKTSSVPSHQGIDLGWNPTGCPRHGHGQGATGSGKPPEAGDSQTDRSTKKKLQICLTIPADTASKCCSLAQKQLQTDLRLTLSLFPVREEKKDIETR